jgi:hypothetical protein
MTGPCCSGDAAPTDSPGAADPLTWFETMLDHCHQYVPAAKADGERVVG